MSALPKTMVIAVAAPPGGGKTTLSTTIAAKLGNAPILHYDDFERFTRQSPAEIEAWLDRGARLDEIPAPGFTEELRKMRTSGAPYVVVDAPLGRAHPPTAAMVDFLIFVDTPLDIALARVVRDQASLAARSSAPGAARNFAAWLVGYLDNYTRFMRRSYDVQRTTVMPQADLVLDGTLTRQRLCELSMPAIAKQRQ
jgi:uridine kinase